MPDQASPPDGQPKTDGSPDPRPAFDLDRFRNFIWPLNLILFTASGIFFGLLLTVCFLRPSGSGTWNLLLVAGGAAGGGGLLGFIYGSYGSGVADRFGPVFSLLGGLLTGATITDLARDDSGINRALNALAASCGLPEGGGLVVAILCMFASLGFMLTYINLGLMLSLPTAQIIDFAARPAQADVMLSREIIKEKVAIIDTKTRGTVALTDNTTTAAAAVLVSKPGAGLTGSAEKLLDDARAFAALGNAEMVEKALRNALKQRPNDPRIKYQLGLHLLFAMEGKEAEAIPYLEEVVDSPDAPASAWKMLGFASLWDASKLPRSIEATRKYLDLYPGDKEARLWLIAAQARLKSPANAQEKADLLGELAALLKDDPTMKQRILETAEDGDADDFRAWRQDPDFLKVLASAP